MFVYSYLRMRPVATLAFGEFLITHDLTLMISRKNGT